MRNLLKYSYHPHRSLEILRGRVSKASTFKEKNDAKLDFPEGWGA